MVRHLKASHAVVLATALVFAGCSALQSVLDTASGTDAEALWRAATVQVIAEGYVDGPTLVAQIEDAEAYLDAGATATIGTMATELRTRLMASDKHIGVKLALWQVVNHYEQRLKDRIGEGALDPDQRVQVRTVLDWIRSAARGSGAE